MESTVSHSTKRRTIPLVLGALGIVYGDLGTSPLYALRECFAEEHNLAVVQANVFGVLSLIFWSLIVIICIKYVIFVLRADNRGEGGVLSLMSLAITRKDGTRSPRTGMAIALGLFGAAFLYGDGIITPSISVLSAVEGLQVYAPKLQPVQVPLTIGILICVFMVQKYGTGKIGAVFGPIILLWFAWIGFFGMLSIFEHPAVLEAINPRHAVSFFLRNGFTGFVVLGSAFLALTGGEALYADMGHFGRKPITIGWFCVALPGLLLNYFGQGALLISHTGKIENPFYEMMPAWALLPSVAIATAAAIIASQAVISGAFSLTRQAVLLGYLPRVNIIHTSAHEIGQIYIPGVNQALLVATISLVLWFKTSSNLTAAYGIAVALTMIITTTLLYNVARHRWGWGRPAAFLLIGSFLVFDVSYCSAVLLKVADGGWLPLVVACSIYFMMTTWRKGRKILNDKFINTALPIEDFIRSITEFGPAPARVAGAAIFMAAGEKGTPVALMHNIKYNHVLHATIVLLTIRIEDVSHLPRKERVKVEDLGHGFYRVVARYGFMEFPSAKEVLRLAKDQGLSFDVHRAGFFVGREIISRAKKPMLWGIQHRLFYFMSRNAQHPTAFFEVPPNQVVELGVPVQL
jgi:KUP system potassium uptake protein